VLRAHAHQPAIRAAKVRSTQRPTKGKRTCLVLGVRGSTFVTNKMLITKKIGVPFGFHFGIKNSPTPPLLAALDYTPLTRVVYSAYEFP
jgi:hypothetical protein